MTLFAGGYVGADTLVTVLLTARDGVSLGAAAIVLSAAPLAWALTSLANSGRRCAVGPGARRAPMRALLDTHIVLWELGGSRRVSAAAQEAIETATELLFSAVSFAEIGVKAALGKLTAPADLRAHVLRSGIRILALEADHGLAVANLPMHHRDPFDRLLIAQARAEMLTIVTADSRFSSYDVPVVAAG